MYIIIKIVLTSGIIVLISELAKKSTLAGALLASVPVVSIIAILWLYAETKDVEKVSQLTSSIFWLVLPSLAFFITLPLLLKQNFSFFISLSCSITITMVLYLILITLLKFFGIKL